MWPFGESAPGADRPGLMTRQLLRCVRLLERTAAWLSIAAAAIHAMAGPEHVEEWWAYGVFFFGAAAFQALYGMLLLTQGIEGWGGWMAVRRKVYGLGMAATVAIIALWVVSRTVGVPVGPEAFEPEGIGPLDVSSKAVEFGLVIALGVLLARTGRPAPGGAERGARSRPPGPA
jgi:hypothetical protein